MQLWAKDYLRHRLDWKQSDEPSTAQNQTRHLKKAYCPCQYVEEFLLQKYMQSENESNASCCMSLNDRTSKVGFDFC
jgi:hypothetical protein